VPKFYSGKDGSLSLQGQQVAKVTTWSLSATTDALETTTLAQVARTYTTGLKSATGSCTVFYYDDAPVNLLEQVNQSSPGTPPTCRLKLQFDTKFFEFDAVLTSANLACTVGEVMQVEIGFQMSGDFVARAL
jgi:hypothetical protein